MRENDTTFLFYTEQLSSKGADLLENAKTSLQNVFLSHLLLFGKSGHRIRDADKTSKKLCFLWNREDKPASGDGGTRTFEMVLI